MKRVLVTGQTGADRLGWVGELAALASQKQKRLVVLNIWGAVSANFDPSTFHNLPPDTRSRALEAAVNEVRSRLYASEKDGIELALILAHAQFFWKGVFEDALQEELLDELHPDTFVTVIRNAYDTADALAGTPYDQMSIQDVVSWRNEEARKTLSWANSYKRDSPVSPFLLLARGEPPETAYGCLFEPDTTKLYASYPMSHVPEKHIATTQRMIEALREHYVVFNPNSITDLQQMRERAPNDRVATEAKLLGDHIVKRDYMLIDQSDAVVVFYPSVTYPVAGETRPGENVPLSAGVIAEMVYAHRSGKRVFAVWYPTQSPSPFFSYHCDDRIIRPDPGASERDIVSILAREIG